MKITASILLLIYYLSGTLLLPMGNFSAMLDLPEMYSHCKSTEDKDMTVVDFITDHLVNIDCILDKHDKGDEQKPHTPIPLNHTQIQVVFTAQQFIVSLIKPCIIENEYPVFIDNFYLSGYIPEIFHPPIV